MSFKDCLDFNDHMIRALDLEEINYSYYNIWQNTFNCSTVHFWYIIANIDRNRPLSIFILKTTFFLKWIVTNVNSNYIKSSMISRVTFQTDCFLTNHCFIIIYFFLKFHDFGTIVTLKMFIWCSKSNLQENQFVAGGLTVPF
jgi:hypothetical protein